MNIALINANFISVLPFLFLIFILLNHALEFFNLVKTTYYDLIYVIGFVTTLMSTDILKQLFFPLFEAAKRPNGAQGCDFFSIKGDVSGRPGFPSGHMSIVSYWACYNILLLLNSPFKGDINLDAIIHSKSKSISKPKSLQDHVWIIFLILLNIGLVILMAWARYFKKCHNIIQIVGGIVFGSLFGYLFFYLSNKFKNIKLI
jgi:membrane-associated phospholipid phosphatase